MFESYRRSSDVETVNEAEAGYCRCAEQVAEVSRKLTAEVSRFRT